ncbi:transmembrane protein 150A isoform X2 [Ictalurus furcatus]|nr:transmembrane protein 150A isoform X2 [Ictalurus furcatus]XP_053477019.1 transmembrane protein 150A isoform X2 [Ictalurus furcatus]XP_053477021.1 transmembrane protein 150A isoform X2 [Ictalurus furcatus]XP_053477022.1 transmembrane protein 150A isoform X2 [Ictalurus furcatus]XP_053477023.1 transmembrane protein 150A isoform X2 [Ictalurus furcatus]
MTNETEICCTGNNIPTISGSGTHFPENSLFSATINGASFLFVVFSIFHHAHILKKCNMHSILSKCAMVSGCIAGVGAFVAGNCNPAELMFLHNLGAALSFVCICFYTVLLTFLTSRCMLTGLERSLYPIRIVFSSIQVTLTVLYCIFFTQKDFYYRHISAIFEWTLSLNLELFEFSYAVEFYFFSSAMLSVLLSNSDEENTIILS